MTYEENRACPKVIGPMTIPERKSTWPQKDSDVYGVGCQSNKYRKDNIQFAARMHNHFCHSIKRFFAHCVKPFLLPWTAVTTSSCDAVQTEIALQVCMYACMTNATAMRRLFLVASRPMLIPFKHRHLVTFLQCQFLQCSSAKPLRQTNVKACQLQLSRNKSRRVCGRFQLVKYEDSRSLP